MNQHLTSRIGHSACPHDCPSTCALDVEIGADGRIGRVYGAKANSYTDGVICAKVARYGERMYHSDRLMKPLVRAGAKGEGAWKEASWEAALDLVADKLARATERDGSQAVWPYYYAGTMGLVQRDGINRLRHAMKWSGQFDSICTNPAWTGYTAATGALRGPDPREMAKSDCVVIWGTNAVATQVNVMTHAVKARKERGAKIVVIDIYDNATMKQADLGLILKPATDAALACAIMHVAFRDGYADRDYMSKFSDDPAGLESHLQSRTPQWAASITGLSVDEIEAVAALIGQTKRTYLRLGYGFTRVRNGTVAMHAAASVATVLGLWQQEGGGAFHSNSDIFKLDTGAIKGTKLMDPRIRFLDQSKIGRVLTGEADSLNGGPPVTALFIQNTNPANVAPEQRKVIAGFRRDDLFTCVHEQFMTDTARLADVVLPATMFLEHDDIYRGGGNQHIIPGPKLVEAPDGPRTNHFVINELAKRLGVADQPGFGLSERELISDMLEKRGLGSFEDLCERRWADVQPPFEEAHYLNGFAHPDGKFRFKPDWTGTIAPNKPPKSVGLMGPHAEMPVFPDHFDVIEVADPDHPFRLATSPARQFLNSTFAETKTSAGKEGRPTIMIHPDDASSLGIEDGVRVEIGNARGEVVLHAKLFGGVKRGVVIAEGLWPNTAHERDEGINVLTGADSIAPYGGAAFHDTKVWVRGI